MREMIVRLLLLICTVSFGEPEEIPEVAPVQQEEISQVYEVTPDDLESETYYDSLELMAICVEAEAGNQSLFGKRLVAAVILNRVEDKTGEWPDTIEEVIMQENQFSTYWDGSMDEIYEPSEESFLAVQMELKERSYPGIYYFTSEGWSEYGTPWKKIEDHYFSKK